MADLDQFNDLAIPVEAEDFARRRRRIWLAVGAAAIIVAAIAGWSYKRQLDPINALDAFDSGERYFRSARYQQALSSFDHAISLRPDYFDAYLMRGRSNAAMSKPSEAIPDFTKCIEMRPDDSVAFLDRGSAQFAIHSYKEALDDFTKAIELDPKLDTAFNLRATTLREIGENEKALVDFDRAVELRPIMNNFFQRGATYQLVGRHELAIADFSSAIKIDPYGPQAYYARALSYRALGNTAAAEQDRKYAAELDGR